MCSNGDIITKNLQLLMHNTQPETLNPKRLSRNSQPDTRNTKLLAVSFLLEVLQFHPPPPAH